MKLNWNKSALLIGTSVLGACQAPLHPTMTNPSKEYTQGIRQQYAAQRQRYPGMIDRAGESRTVGTLVNSHGIDEAKARMRFVAGEDVPQVQFASSSSNEAESGFTVEPSTMQHTREYTGPLALGEPGVAASLWQESRAANELFRDDRAWQPMDLLTIVVSEKSEGKKEANTEVKQKSTVEAAIDNLLGFETDLKQGLDGKNNGVTDVSSLLKASTQNDFKGEGKTNRKGSLTAKISAMVAEVLPSGILRIEGKKIISVNSEEQVMVISGLVRPKDISSDNEVDSSKIAQLRVDYYGEGTVGESQRGGWLGRILRTVWPF